MSRLVSGAFLPQSAARIWQRKRLRAREASQALPWVCDGLHTLLRDDRNDVSGGCTIGERSATCWRREALGKCFRNPGELPQPKGLPLQDSWRGLLRGIDVGAHT